MAVDDEGGVSKLGSMPWPKNSSDLKWFKEHTLNQVVIMGRLTWEDPFMPTPLTNRINVLITAKPQTEFFGVDDFISNNLKENILKIVNKYQNLEKWVIGGPNIVEQFIDLIDIFYLTRVYGKFDCDKKLDLSIIKDSMFLKKKILNDKTCHFEIWKK
jgi:dihydrofolate reductase